MTNPDNLHDLTPELKPESHSGNGSRGVWKDFLLLFLSSGSIIALDFWTKDLVEKNLPLGKSWLPDQLSALSPYVRIIHLQNKGTAFGLFSDQNQINLLISIIAIAASLFIF